MDAFNVQGALFTAKGLAQGVGPLCFSFMFTYFTQKNHYAPEVPVASLGVIMALGAGVAASLQVPTTAGCDRLDDNDAKHHLLRNSSCSPDNAAAHLSQAPNQGCINDSIFDEHARFAAARV